MQHKSAHQTVILDTNIWISSIIEDEAFHYESKRLIAKFLNKDFHFIIPQPIILETINVLSKKKFPKNIIKDMINEYVENKKFQVACIDTDELIEVSLRNLDIKGLSSNDYYILMYTIFLKPDVFLTLDNKLMDAYNRHVKNHRPL